MGLTKQNTYVVGSNNDLSNALAMIDLNRVGLDLVYMEDDAGTPKVSIGSLIEANGSVWAVTGAAEEPSGTVTTGAILYFDPAIPEFRWVTAYGDYDPTRGGIYDGTGRRECNWCLTRDTAPIVAMPLMNTLAQTVNGFGGGLVSDAGMGKFVRVIRDIGVWDMLLLASKTVDLSDIFDDTASSVLHFLSVEAWIIPDNGSFITSIAEPEVIAGGDPGGRVRVLDSAIVAMQRTVGGTFDNTGYDDGTINRGFVVVDWAPKQLWTQDA